MNRINEIIDRDDFELEWVLRHKQNPDDYPLNIPEMQKMCNEILCHCECGMIIGENYHGGMTTEEWRNRKQYIEKVLNEL